MKSYPAIRLFSRFGRLLAWVVFGCAVVAALIGAKLIASPILTGGIVIALLALGIIIRLGAELVEVVSDTLIPC